MARNHAKQVGALWRHEKESVGTYLTGILDLGELGDVPIAVFQNQRKKKGSKEPDYRILLSEKPPRPDSIPSPAACGCGRISA